MSMIEFGVCCCAVILAFGTANVHPGLDDVPLTGTIGVTGAPLAGRTPVLALDMYEHSYHLDYGAKAADYVGVFMAAINWPAVQRLYDGVRK